MGLGLSSSKASSSSSSSDVLISRGSIFDCSVLLQVLWYNKLDPTYSHAMNALYFTFTIFMYVHMPTNACVHFAPLNCVARFRSFESRQNMNGSLLRPLAKVLVFEEVPRTKMHFCQQEGNAPGELKGRERKKEKREIEGLGFAGRNMKALLLLLLSSSLFVPFSVFCCCC